MIASHTLSLARRKVEPSKLSWFRFGALADGVILTTDHGRWHHMPEAEFHALLAGEIEPGHPQYDALASKGFLRDQTSLDDVAATVRGRKRYVGVGPQLHILHTAGEDGARLGVETAKEILDHVMLSTAHQLELRVVAPPGTHDADLLAFLLQYGTEKNRYEGKGLTWRYVTDLASVPEAARSWLVDKKVVVQTRLDGPAALHDAQRTTGPDHATVRAAIAALHAAAATRSRSEWRVQADVHVGAANAHAPAEVVAELVDAGIRRVRLHPIAQGPNAINATTFRAFYAGFLDALLASEAAGAPIVDERTATLATRVLKSDAGSDVDMRSPSAAGLGVLVYDHQGQIFPCEAARALNGAGDDMFLLGKAGVLSYKDCMSHATLRTLAIASVIESLPGFADHWSTPWCGVDPVAAYAETGDLFARPHGFSDAGFQFAQIGVFFERLLEANAETLATLGRWSA